MPRNKAALWHLQQLPLHQKVQKFEVKDMNWPMASLKKASASFRTDTFDSLKSATQNLYGIFDEPRVCPHAGGTIITLQGNGIPVSPFQAVNVTFRGSPLLGCRVTAVTESLVQCVTYIPDGVIVPAATTSFEAQLLANGRPAPCGDCSFALSNDVTPLVATVTPKIAPAIGTITVVLGGPEAAAASRK